MDQLLLKIVAFSYFVGTVGYLLYLIRPRARFARTGLYAIILGFTMHFLVLIVSYHRGGHVPVTNINEAFSFFGWVIIGIFLISQIAHRIPVLGSIVTPLALVFCLSSFAVPQVSEGISKSLQSLWLPLHVIVAFSGNAVFALAFCVGVLYLFQERQLKKKRPGTWYRRLPSLEVLDHLNYRCLTFGFPLLTLGMLTGTIWAKSAWGADWSWGEPRLVWSLVIWFLYAAILHARLTAGWRGRKAAALVIIGFISVVFSFVAVHFLMESRHQGTFE